MAAYNPLIDAKKKKRGKRDATLRRAHGKAKGRKKRRKPRIDPLLEQAQNESLIAYGPQLRGLAQLMSESKSDYQGELRAADVSSAGIMSSIDRARPEMAAAFGRAGALTGGSYEQANQDIRGLSAAADPYKAVSFREHAGAVAEQADLARRTEADLIGQRTNAAAGRVYQRSAARSRYTAQREKHRAAQLGLHEDVGRFTIKAYGDLQAAEEKNKREAQKLRLDRQKLQEAIRKNRSSENIALAGLDLRRTEEAGRNARDRTGGGGRGSGGRGRGGKFTPVQLRTARAQWKKAVSFARAYAAAGKLRRSTGNDVVRHLSGKSIDEPIARGAVQTILFGGVRGSQRTFLERNYGLKPRRISRSPGRTIKRVGSGFGGF